MLRSAALRIHHYLATRHVCEGALTGPDPGVRFNYRIGRFIKSWFPRAPWRDDLYYVQAQGYWMLANWLLAHEDADACAQLAVAAAEQVVARQRPDGAWDYPNPEWRGRVATVEGMWGAIGLLESHRRTGKAAYLEAVLRWDQFFHRQIGFQSIPQGLAVNYFAGEVAAPVPNNSALALRYLARLAEATDDRVREPCDGLLQFLQAAQSPTGELPYVFGDSRWQHFQCYQYHAFMCLDLLDYYRLTGDARALGIAERMLGFLRSGVSAQGFVHYQCGNSHRTVHYHTGAVAAALASAAELLGVPAGDESGRALRWLIAQIRADGSVPHSRGDYRLLRDQRSYPRYLAMMIVHLLAGDRATEFREPIDMGVPDSPPADTLSTPHVHPVLAAPSDRRSP